MCIRDRYEEYSLNRKYDIIFRNQNGFSKEPEDDPKVIFAKIVKFVHQWEQISKALSAVSDPLILLSPDRSNFRADAFTTSSKELGDLWRYECLPYLNKKLCNAVKIDLNDEKLKLIITTCIQSLQDLKRKALASNIENEYSYALQDAFKFSDDFENPFELPQI